MKLKHLITAWLIGLCATAAIAEEAKSSDKTDESKKPTETRERPVADDGKRSRRPGDVFKPSEEISEDFAVSFPVDI